jgi:RNA polymerase sigma factor (sigma-70 family)
MRFMSTYTESSATRPSLLARLKDWSHQTAWCEFEHVYAPLIRNVARKAGLTDAETDDVTQESLIAVAKNIGDFKHRGNRGSFRAWLYQQTRWRIADRFRARCKFSHRTESRSLIPGRGQSAREGGLADDSFFPETKSALAPEVDPTFLQIWEWEWEEHVRQSAVVHVKRRVTGRQFQLFDLHVLQGLSAPATAQAAGTTIAAVYMAKSRVGRVFKREIKKLMAE